MKTDARCDGKTVYLTPSGVRVGAKGKVMPRNFIPTLFGKMDKGNVRKLRKAMRQAGWTRDAAAQRITPEDWKALWTSLQS